MSYWGINIDSDQYLVIAHLRAWISNINKVTGIITSIYNVFKLTSLKWQNNIGKK
jgi:hypothetical protein